jgi:hypothetical protein
VTPSKLSKVTISSVDKKELQLKSDGTPGTIVVSGKNLDQISSAQVVLNGRVVRDVKVEMERTSGSSRQVKIQALSNARIARNYQLRLMSGDQQVDLPIHTLKMEVIRREGAPSSKPTAEVTSGKYTAVLQKAELKAIPRIDTIKKGAAAVAIQPVAGPDLVVEEIIVPSNDINSNSDVDITVKIKNQGDADAAIPNGWTLLKRQFSWECSSCWASSPLYANLTVSPGELVTRYIHLYGQSSKPGGTHTVTIVVDPDDLVKESNEDNNSTVSEVFTIIEVPPTPPTDLIISEMRLDPPNPSIWDTIHLVITVKNIGQTVTYPAHTPILRFWRAGWGGTMNNINELILGPQMTEEFWLKLTRQEAGTFTWGAEVDYNNVIDEADETNNENTLTATITEN